MCSDQECQSLVTYQTYLIKFTMANKFYLFITAFKVH